MNIDHLQYMSTQEGPISWITSGKVDAVMDIKFPRDYNKDSSFNALIGEIADAITTAASSAVAERIPGQRELAKPPLSAPSDQTAVPTDSAEHPKVVIDIDLRFRDLKAVDMTRAGWPAIVLGALAATVAVGPGATVGLGWLWREQLLATRKMKGAVTAESFDPSKAMRAAGGTVKANGHANGRANGHANGHANGNKKT